MKDFFEDEPILTLIFSLIFFAFLFLIVDVMFSESISFSGIVVDKHYKAESSSVGTGTAYTSKGMAVVTTYQSSPEEYSFAVKDRLGNIVTANCEANLYYKKELTQKVECYNDVGFFSKIIWCTRAVR